MGLGATLRRLRLQRGYGIRELERATGISASYLSRIERFDHQPSVDRALRLAIVLGCSIEELLGDEAATIRADMARRSADGAPRHVIPFTPHATDTPPTQ